MSVERVGGGIGNVVSFNNRSGRGGNGSGGEEVGEDGREFYGDGVEGGCVGF